MSKSKSKAAAAAEEAEVRYEMTRGLLQAAGIGPSAVAEAALMMMAGAAVGREEFVQALKQMVVAAGRVQDGWDAVGRLEPGWVPDDEAAAAATRSAEIKVRAAQNECNCRSCQLRMAAQGGPVVVEEATAEEAAELLAAFGEGS